MTNRAETVDSGRSSTSLGTNGASAAGMKEKPRGWRAESSHPPTFLRMLFLCLAVCLVLPACDELRHSDEDRCGVTNGVQKQVGGKWVIGGTGTRKSCQTERFNSAFSLTNSQVIEIRQFDRDPNVAGEDLELLNPIANVTFSGTVQGSCIRFIWAETSPTIIRYDFSGAPSGNQITGQFTGTGPESCVATGSFDVTFGP